MLLRMKLGARHVIVQCFCAVYISVYVLVFALIQFEMLLVSNLVSLSEIEMEHLITIIVYDSAIMNVYIDGMNGSE